MMIMRQLTFTLLVSIMPVCRSESEFETNVLCTRLLIHQRIKMLFPGVTEHCLEFQGSCQTKIKKNISQATGFEPVRA